AHFTACAGCRTEYETWARAIELVGALPRVEVTPGLAERTLARARRATVAPDRLPVRPARWIPVTATAALLTIAATMLMQWMAISLTRAIRTAIPGLALVLAVAAAASAQGTLSALQTDVDQIARRARPSVVTVFALRTEAVAKAAASAAPVPPRVRTRVGSGVAVDEHLVLTTASVGLEAERLLVSSANGLQVEA